MRGAHLTPTMPGTIVTPSHNSSPSGHVPQIRIQLLPPQGDSHVREVSV